MRERGANKLETAKMLLDAGASLDLKTFTGSTLLMNAVLNEDSDPDVVRLLLEKFKSSRSAEEFSTFLNYKKIPTSMKWKCIYFTARMMYRTGMSKSLMMDLLAFDSGSAALIVAVTRGDIEIVKILLENGADPYVENDLGMNAFDICDKAGPFPSVKRALQKHVNETHNKKK